MPTLPIIAVICFEDEFDKWIRFKYADGTESDALLSDTTDIGVMVETMDSKERAALCYAFFCQHEKWIEV